MVQLELVKEDVYLSEVVVFGAGYYFQFHTERQQCSENKLRHEKFSSELSVQIAPKHN